MITYVNAATRPRRAPGIIPLHGEEGFNGMRKVGKLAAKALDMLSEHVRPGISTGELDRLAFEFGREHNAAP